MKQEINISVVIPMYNSEKTIVRALESVRQQTSIEYIKEVIIINDGSIDLSLDIVKKYRYDHPEIKIRLFSQKNKGVSAARNFCLKESKGNWIALLDADDEWLPEKIEKQIKVLLKNPEIDFIGGKINNKPLKILWKKIDTLHKADIKELCIKAFPQTSTVLFRRKIYEDIGGYDENMKYAEDMNYFMKICLAYNYYCLPEQLVIYDGGKKGFGQGGLSGNLKEMYLGNVKNLIEIKKIKKIKKSFYFLMRIFYFFKYIRRKLIVKYNNQNVRF